LACLLVFCYHSALNLQAGKIVWSGATVSTCFFLSGYLLGGKLLEKLSAGDKRWTIFV
jgi:peptidoglycan/LPS O-acetylase OafA/YrhL